jgi:uncharacterized protein
VASSNPFHFGSPADGAHFCDREQEVGTVLARMTDGIHAFLLGPRRYGKTSIVSRAIERFRAAGGRAGYCDLIRCTTELDVATEVLNAVANGVLRRPRRTAVHLESVVRRLRITPTVSVDTTGAVVFGFDPHAAQRSWSQILDDALELLEEAGSQRPAALALDEFQRVADIGREGMGGVFKAATDRLTHSSLVLAGSQLSVMEKLTKERGAPLYGMGELVTIDAIPSEEMIAFLRRRARLGGKSLAPQTARLLYERAAGVPNDVQWLAYTAYEEAGDRTEIGDETVAAALAVVVSRQSSSFAERFEDLSPSQQRVLKVLAAEPTPHVYAKAFLDAVGVANANAVRKALQVLIRAELVHRRAGVYEVANPFLAAWLAG